MGLGVENSRLPEAESVTSIVDRAEEALKWVAADPLLLNPDYGFATFANRPVNAEEFLPKKIHAMVEASDILLPKYAK
ncbi:MAG: hypothetical protein Q4A55_01765 [Aerococcus sp.]|nr:hypothetical protein [Aerococcus sp.]